MTSTIHNEQTIQEKHEHDYKKPKIMRSSGIVSPSEVVEKAKRLAELQEEIYTLSKSLPNQLHLEGVYCKRRKNSISLNIIYEQLFYQESIDVTLRCYEDKREIFYKKFGVETNCEIDIDVFSDYDAEKSFREFTKTYQGHSMWLFAETSYYFDKQGRSAKVIHLPAKLHLQKTVLEELYTKKTDVTEDDIIYVCLSDMMPEDFILVERALTIIYQRCLDYLTWSKIHLFS